MNELIAAIANKDMANFKNKYRNADVLLIDDIQFVAGKESMQEEFFNTFNAVYETGKQIILTSDRPPKEIKPLSDRLRTRFEGGLIADVQKPSFELRTAILRKKSNDMNITISNELIDYMAERLQHDIRQIEGALKKLKALYLINGLSITKESIDNVISSIDPANIPTDVLVEKILTTVAKYYGVRVEDILSKSKTDNIAYARHISVYVIKKLTDLSYKAIGSFIGGRDHSTVISSYNKVEQYISTKKNTESDIKKIIRDVKG
jgi:chromosomal replication initiator protein